MKAQKSGIFLFAVVLVLISSSVGCAGTPAASKTPTTLKEAYKDYFKIGVAINRLVTTGRTDVEADNANRTPEQLVKDIAIVKEQFNAIVNENDLKPILIHPNPGPEGYVWEFGDAFVKFGEDNDMYVTGHTLLWHSQVPNWFFEGTETEEETSAILNLNQVFGQVAPEAPQAGARGTRGARGARGTRGVRGGAGGGMFGGFGRGNMGPRATREELIERMREHIHSVVGRYKGKVKVWDVVNEAIGDGGSTYRSTQWVQIIGEDFIPMAFKFAHEADPDAILRYNDYGLEGRDRREKLKKIVQAIRDAGAPIHAIGTQTHINANTTFKQMDETLTDLETLGLPIHVTELDMNVSMGGQRGTGANLADNAAATSGGLISQADLQQSKAYAELFKALIKHKDSVDLVVFWGVCDAVSWRRNGSPLLFDGEDNKKPSFDAVMKVAIEAKENNYYQD
ncbi:MAG: endo-1,4-beta-xylanase [Sedimentisphaerales bacterium]|nr:endo-1,4-beta-xylanase [Sedimentisphaerales bacterium]